MAEGIRAKRLAGQIAPFKGCDGIAQRRRNARQRPGGVDIAHEDTWWLDLILNAVETCRQRRGVGDVWIGVGTRNAALDAQRAAMADHTKTSGAIVIAPGDASRSE